MLLSVVVPVYNESEGIESFHKLLLAGLRDIQTDHEILYIDDGSRDDSGSKLLSIAKKDSTVRVVSLSRNFGKEIATTAGIHLAKGDAVIILDADGQHPPELIKEFVDKWQLGAKVVVGIREKNSKEGFVKRYGSKFFYKIFNSTTGHELIPGSTDFRLIDRLVQQEFIKFSERNRITRGLIDWLGFKRDYITFESPERMAGEASYKTSQLFKLAINSFTTLSLKPLFFFGWVGAFITVGSFLLGLFILIEQFLLRDPLALHFSGPAILGIFMSFLVGLVLISQSVLATYVSHIHAQTQGRPLFVIDESRSVNHNPTSQE